MTSQRSLASVQAWPGWFNGKALAASISATCLLNVIYAYKLHCVGAACLAFSCHDSNADTYCQARAGYGVQVCKLVKCCPQARLLCCKMAYDKYQACHGAFVSCLLSLLSSMLSWLCVCVRAAATLTAQYNNLDSVREVFAANKGEIAGVILEPVVGNSGYIAPSKDFLKVQLSCNVPIGLASCPCFLTRLA